MKLDAVELSWLLAGTRQDYWSDIVPDCRPDPRAYCFTNQSACRLHACCQLLSGIRIMIAGGTIENPLGQKIFYGLTS